MDEPQAKKPKIEESNNAENTEPTCPPDAKARSALCERDVGISCYISTGFKPIPGIVKQRFSDFVVNEIDLNGEIVRLTSTSPEPQPNSRTRVVEKADVGSEAKRDMGTPVADCPLPTDVVSELKSIVAGEAEKNSVKVLAPAEKDERRKIHVYIKANFPSMCSNCIEDNGVKYLEISATAGNKSVDRRNQSNAWPKDRPPHLHLVLYKEFKDTMEAVDVISKYSGIKPQQFNYAGTKDRRAKTSQRVSLHKVSADKLEKVNKKLRGIAMGNFHYSTEKIALGQLSGNHFKIVLRNVDTTEENLQQATDSIRQSGFINYFGMQRFGTTSIPTYEIGIHMLRGRFVKAVDLIMAPRDTDKSSVTETRQLWKEKRDAQAVLNKLPRSFNIERRLMQGVIKSGVGNLVSAMDSIPRTTRLLYLHSYQSYVWNRVASLRIQKYGLEPIVGDLVYVKEPTPNTASVVSEELSALVPEESPAPADSTDTTEQSTEPTNKPVVKLLTASDVDKYTIYDIILPLPGYSVVLPGNEMKDKITQLLTEDNLSIDTFKSKHKQYRLPGSYRHLVVKPSNVASSLGHYDDTTEELVQSDLDILNNKVLEKKDSGKFKAAILEFGLPSSCYATMLLREVMRTDTSAHHQTSLNTT